MNKILKFGGTSLSTPERIKKVIKIIIKSQKDHSQIAVVFSALGGVTDQLIQIASLAAQRKNYKKLLKELEKRHLNTVESLITKQNQSQVLNIIRIKFRELQKELAAIFSKKELSLKDLDLVMSFGEWLSTYIISQALKNQGLKAEFLDARKFIRTDESFGAAQVDYKVTYRQIKNYFKKAKALPAITGFIASSHNGQTTTLGRGGSDFTAALFGAALSVDEVEIWTDVDGVMTTDPRKVANAFPIKTMTYEEAMEMSHFGAKVIYPPTIRPVLDKKIPIRIRNSFNPKFSGTFISDQADSADFSIRGITSVEQIALLRVQGAGMIGVAGISQRLFGALAKEKISVILISQASSEHSICCAIDSKVIQKAKKAVAEEFSFEIQQHFIDQVVIEDNLLILAIVGENMRRKPGVSGELFKTLGRNRINVVAIAQGSSELNISIVINKEDEVRALNTIHQTFFMPKENKLDLFMLGTGNIGKTLLKQIKKSWPNIRLIALGNSRKMVFNHQGISLSNWEQELEDSLEAMDTKDFVEKIKKFDLGDSVFVDCTASEFIASHYQDIMRSGISIVTPNKIANSKTYQIYQELKEIALKNKVSFFYETNVGAGLPIISTINNLISSGDKIIKIEAVLSGTLSYIFNSFTGQTKFSQIVKQAKEKGYTEPDPRDDLSGLDVARKLLILGREAGFSLELEDINFENLVPKKYQKIKSVDQFLTQLPELDDYFEGRKKQAAQKNKVLRYIAKLENGQAEVLLQEVNQDHPFYALSGSDNIISITTQRYKKRPLVIKGPGAGAEVTAAGVLADIVRNFNL